MSSHVQKMCPRIKMRISLLLILASQTICSEVDELTRNFFNNLATQFTDESTPQWKYSFADKQINNFMHLMNARYSNNIGHRHKRQIVTINETDSGVQVLEGFKPVGKLPLHSSRDLALFQHNINSVPIWYAAVLQHNKLIIFKQNNEQFERIDEVGIRNGVRLGIFTTTKTFIVVAENSTKHVGFDLKTAVYLFDEAETLQKIQNLHIDYASDVAIWSDKRSTFMAIPEQFQSANTQEELSCATSTTIFQWLGGHFDIVQKLNSTCAVRVAQFSIGKSQFIAIANRRNRLDNDDDEVFSEVFKYNLDTEQFVSYQKLGTVNASDLKFFAFRTRKQQESYLIIANAARSLVYKFVDGFFLPFQCFDEPSVKQWLPITGKNGEFALFAITRQGKIIIYQYNGWKFVERSIEMPSTTVSSLRAFHVDDSIILAVSSEDNAKETDNLFTLNFQSQNHVSTHSQHILEWCSRNKKLLTRPKSKRNAEDDRTTVINLRSVEADLSNGTNVQNNLAFVEIQMENLSQQLQKVKGKMNSELQTSSEQTLIIDGDLNADRIIINSDIVFAEVVSNSLNGVNVSKFLNGVVPINQQSKIHLQALEIDQGTIANDFVPRIVNGHPIEELLLKSEITHVENLVIEGNLRVQKLNIKGTINEIVFNTSNILLKQHDQSFNGDISLEKIEAMNVKAPMLNAVNLTALTTSNATLPDVVQVSHLERLNVKHLNVAGFLNNLDLPTLNKHALKLEGNQELIADYSFDELHLNNLQSNTLNDIALPADLILTSPGSFSLPHDVQLNQDLRAKILTIRNSLNEIHVHETSGKLDVLLNNHPEMQVINGKKIIQNVELLNPMKLQGKIDSHSLQELNPVAKLNIPVELWGNFTITGNVTIENLLEAQDIITESGEHSIAYLKQHGLRLSDTEIPVQLNFSQPIDVIDIFADTINGVDTRKWVVNGERETQIINGWKTFNGNVAIIGATNLQVVNHINVPNLEADILTIDGNQIITGKHIFASMEAPSVISNITMLNSTSSMEEVMENNKVKDIPEMVVSQLSVNKLEAANVIVWRNFNGINFIEMLEDTLFKDQNVKVTGAKVFEHLHIQNLTSRKSIDMNRIPTLIERGEAITGTNTLLELPKLEVDRITFKNDLNNLSSENFHENWLDSNLAQTITGDQVLEKVVIYGDLQVLSDEINNLNLGEMVRNTVKSDEEHHFDNVSFSSGIICSMVTLQGHIEDLDIDSILAENGQEIFTSLKFKESLTILTPIKNEGTINGLNFSHLCNYGNPHHNEPPKSLTIDGHSVLLKHPIIRHLNGHDMQKLRSSVWFNDIPSNLTANLKATHINFLDDVEVSGLVDGVNLHWLNENYLSKTSNQTIPATMTFLEGIHITGSLNAQSTQVARNVNGVDLNEFVANAILQGWNQTFEDTAFVEECRIDSLRGNFLVNGQNLHTDVLRYDGENMVTGKTVIGNLNVEHLNLSRNVRVQNVDLLKWTQDGILRSGSQRIEGRLLFSNFTVFENGVGLTGFLNRRQFNKDKVMLKSQSQTITGRKTFLNGPIDFQNIKIKGTLNNIVIGDMLHQQALQNKDNTFESQIDFHTSIAAQNVNFHRLFQGINVTELLDNLTRTAFVDNYFENYSKLKETSLVIQNSLEHSAYFLNHFKILQRLEAVIDVVPMRNVHGHSNLVTLRFYNETYLLDFFQWSPQHRIFNIDSAMEEIFFKETVTRFMPLEYDFETQLYVEVEYADGNGNTKLGNVMSKQATDEFAIIAYLPNNGTLDVLALFLPKVQKSCVLLVHAQMPYMDIFCHGNKAMILHQRLPIVNPIQVRVAKFTDTLEIIAIERRDGKNASSIPSVMIWRYDENTELFNEAQQILSATPISVAIVESPRAQKFLAIASAHLMNTMYAGHIDIKKYDPTTRKYHNWQVIKVDAPLQIELAVLPSNEILLYVLRDNPTEVISIYQYAGIAKFEPRAAIATLSNCAAIVPFSSQSFKEHFLIAKCNGAIDILQSIFKR